MALMIDPLAATISTGIQPPASRARAGRHYRRLPGKYLPGIGICIALALVAEAIELAELRLFGTAWLEALVLALVVGLAVRCFWKPAPVCEAGMFFSSKILLELAIVLLGASVSVGTVLALGPGLLAGIACVVVVSLLAGYAVCRMLKLQHRLALLVACGNAICGNSAIVAAAPVIGAAAEDVAAAIAFTAGLGVLVVLFLPLLIPLLHLSLTQYGVLAGLTVYAVPQVLAATLPIGALSNQVGTVVKLVRVLMLGPVVACLALAGGRGKSLPPLRHLLPWFIAGFIVMLSLRSLGLIPSAALPVIKHLATGLTCISMAGLGLRTNIRSVAGAGPRVTIAVMLSLLILAAISLGLISLLHLH